ncbi:MAG: transferrin-binding protein-like solute binding protein [gamma proteobacterium symbiont of Lucinoma myriamae]|nr:transferrin-binding protein-like solute binding protein [gamma proteobacterium symbiont of Lucinoma myriamae]
MISGNLQARYTGNSALYQQDVTIDVDFGKESFSGNWKNGTNEAFDFGATGKIQGQHIVATTITGGTGLVQGSFYGVQAKNLGGAYEVNNGVKTIRDVFATTQGANNSVNFKSNEY